MAASSSRWAPARRTPLPTRSSGLSERSSAARVRSTTERSSSPATPAAPAAEGKHSTYKVLYWQEIPSQIKVSDDAGNEVSVELPPKFAERIDQLAHQRGFQNSDDYLAHWKWSDEHEREGSAKNVADAVKAELEAAVKW